MVKPVYVSKPYLPPLNEYLDYLKEIWVRQWVTNNGPLVVELESKLKEYLGVKHLFLVTNGTIALQIAIKALALKDEVITTPFSYVATSSSLVWENCQPLYADIDPEFLTLNPLEVDKIITPNTTGILATHVFGNPCDVESFAEIGRRHSLPILYDAAHAFGVNYKGNSLLNWGSVSILSLHATKIFHTIEGGALITNDDNIAHKISCYRNFGLNNEKKYCCLGINGKMSEFHAALGLCNLNYICNIIKVRKKITNLYNQFLSSPHIRKLKIREYCNYNYAYYPVIFKNEKKLNEILKKLNEYKIFPRRYFYPPLSKLAYTKSKKILNHAESISSRILCLPITSEMTNSEIEKISYLILKSL